jgi:hypothetical protein
MAAFEAVLSLGLAIAYILAGPVLRAVGPQPVYRIGGLTALVAALTLSPLIRLRHAPEIEPGSQSERHEDVHEGSRRFTSADSMDGEPVGVLGATSDRPAV